MRSKASFLFSTKSTFQLRFIIVPLGPPRLEFSKKKVRSVWARDILLQAEKGAFQFTLYG
ncbi:MAG: hypothetical protein MG2_0724 [uncultured Candidatus Poseidoniales archaeon]|nr:MAG: hypothetical protein MG2_0724 [uncultured Candidatus Poseidoniales archaeon]